MRSPDSRTLRIGGAVGALLLLGLFAVRSPRRPGAPRTPPRADASAAPPVARPPHDPMRAADAPAPSAPRDGDASLPPLDCARPAGDVARVDGAPITASRLCARLASLGALRPSGVIPAQARLNLDQLIDATLVARALAWERAAVTDAELSAALAALDAGAPSPDAGLLGEQLRERLELSKLATLRQPPQEVTESDVDAEIARGAPGIDRGQGVRVEAWIARVPPATDPDAAVRATARQSAEDFARAVQTEAPDAAAARLHLARVAPFVLSANGVEPELERAALALGTGHWSEALSTRVGWMVLRPLGRVEGARLPDAVLRARVRAALLRQRLSGTEASVIAALRNAARIEVLVEM